MSLKRYRYTGKERDEESGFNYHGARYYVPWLARWTSCDPAGLVDGANAFAYVRNNPMILVDVTGQQAGPWEPFVRLRKFQEAVNEVLGPPIKAIGAVTDQVVQGDFYEGETTWGGVGANVGVGLIPIVGQVADARDTAAAIKNVWNNPRSGGNWGMLGMAAVGWVPGIGDALKGGGKAGKKVLRRGNRESCQRNR